MPSYLSVYFSVEMLFCQFEKLKNTSVLSAFNRVECQTIDGPIMHGH